MAKKHRERRSKKKHLSYKEIQQIRRDKKNKEEKQEILDELYRIKVIGKQLAKEYNMDSDDVLNAGGILRLIDEWENK